MSTISAEHGFQLVRINIMSQILFYGEYVHLKKNSMGFHIFFDPILWDFIFFSTLFYGKIAPKLPYMNRSQCICQPQSHIPGVHACSLSNSFVVSCVVLLQYRTSWQTSWINLWSFAPRFPCTRAREINNLKANTILNTNTN